MERRASQFAQPWVLEPFCDTVGCFPADCREDSFFVELDTSILGEFGQLSAVAKAQHPQQVFVIVAVNPSPLRP